MTLKALLPPISLMVGIFLLSSIPGEVDGGALKILLELDPQLQNLLHIPLFGLLQFLWLRAFGKAGRQGFKFSAICFGITLGYGVLDELHQLFIPGRYASLLDMLLDGVGAALGTVVFGWMTVKKTRIAN